LKELKRDIHESKGEFNEGYGGPSHEIRDYVDDIIADNVTNDNGCCSAKPSFSVFGKDMDDDEEVEKATDLIMKTEMIVKKAICMLE